MKIFVHAFRAFVTRIINHVVVIIFQMKIYSEFPSQVRLCHTVQESKTLFNLKSNYKENWHVWSSLIH